MAQIKYLQFKELIPGDYKLEDVEEKYSEKTNGIYYILQTSCGKKVFPNAYIKNYINIKMKRFNKVEPFNFTIRDDGIVKIF